MELTLTHHQFSLEGEFWDLRARAQAAKEPNAAHCNVQPRYSLSSLLRHNRSPKPLRADLELHGKEQHLVGAQAGDHHARARSRSWWSKASPSVSANEAFRTAESEEPRFRKRLGKYDWEICSSSPHRITRLDFCVPRSPFPTSRDLFPGSSIAYRELCRLWCHPLPRSASFRRHHLCPFPALREPSGSPAERRCKSHRLPKSSKVPEIHQQQGKV